MDFRGLPRRIVGRRWNDSKLQHSCPYATTLFDWPPIGQVTKFLLKMAFPKHLLFSPKSGVHHVKCGKKSTLKYNAIQSVQANISLPISSMRSWSLCVCSVLKLSLEPRLQLIYSRRNRLFWMWYWWSLCRDWSNGISRGNPRDEYFLLQSILCACRFSIPELFQCPRSACRISILIC